MKKFRFLLSLVVMFSLLSSLAFAGNVSIKLSDVEYTGSDVTVTVALSEESSENLTITGGFCWDTDVWEWVSKTGNIYGAPSDTSLEILVDDEVLSDNKTIGTVTLRAKAGANVSESESFSFEYLEDGDGNELSYSGGSVSVKKQDTVISAAANTEVAGYTDVVNFSSSISGVTGTNPKLAFDLYENGVKHNSYEVSIGNGVTFSGGTLSFKIAVFGAPSDKTITLVNPTVE